MTATLVPFLLIVVALTGYSLLLLAVCVPRARRNAYLQGFRDAARARATRTPSNVAVLPCQRGGAA